MNSPNRTSRREFSALIVAFGLLPFAVSACSVVSAQDGHLQARPGTAAPTTPAVVGEHPLGLASDRDGLLYVPKGFDPNQPTSVALMLHGAGRDSQGMRSTFPIADEFGVVIVAPDSRGRTWDAIRGHSGPDVEFIDVVLKSVFAQVRVNPKRLAVGGFSDGASYALGLGLANGDLFSHVLAFSPGFVTGQERQGKPPVFIIHGTQDRVLPIDQTSREIVPELKGDGYTVEYREFDGPHRLLPENVRQAFAWLAR